MGIGALPAALWAVGGLLLLAACAGPSAAAPANPGQQTLPAPESPFDATDLPPSSAAVAPATQPTSQGQAPAPVQSNVAPQGQTTSSNQQSEVQTKGTGDSSKQSEYTWQDGDRTMTVMLETDLAVGEEVPGAKSVYGDAPESGIVRAEDVPRGSKSDPVFRSQSGALMTLPGGVLLVLDPKWSAKEITAFFSTNNISGDRVEKLGYIENGFFVETASGFPSLDLANELAAQDGVLISSPNWWTEVTVK